TWSWPAVRRDWCRERSDARCHVRARARVRSRDRTSGGQPLLNRGVSLLGASRQTSLLHRRRIDRGHGGGLVVLDGSRRQAWWRWTARSTASPRLCHRCQRPATWTAWGAPSRAPSTAAAAINAALTISKGLTAEDTARAAAVFVCLKLDDTFPPGLAACTSISSKSSCSVPARVEIRIRAVPRSNNPNHLSVFVGEQVPIGDFR